MVLIYLLFVQENNLYLNIVIVAKIEILFENDPPFEDMLTACSHCHVCLL